MHIYSDVGTGGGGSGATAPAPIFSRSINPISTGEGQIIPTYYYWPLQIFSPSGITDIFLTLVKKLPSYILLTCTNRCIKLKQCACFFWPDVSRQIYHLWVPNSTYVIHSSSREGVDIKVCLQFYVKSCMYILFSRAKRRKVQRNCNFHDYFNVQQSIGGIQQLRRTNLTQF